MITDDTGPIGLAAVMGGASTEIGDGTDDRAPRGGALGPDRGRPHGPPAQAAQRGRQAVRARRRPGADRGRAGARRRAARRVRRRHAWSAASSTSTPAARARRSRSTPPSPRGSPASPTRRPRSSSCWSAVGCDGRRRRRRALRGHPAVLAARPHRPGRPGRGGRPARRLRRRPLGAAHRAARPRAHRRAAPPPRHRPRARRGRLRRGAVLPVRRRRRCSTRSACPPTTRGAQVVRPAQPAVGGGAGAAHHAAARPAGHAGPQPLPRPARRRAVRARRGVPRRRRARPAPLPGVDRRPDDATIAALLAAVPAQPWHVAVALAGSARAARLVGRRAGRRRGPTPCRPPGCVAAAVRGRADRPGGGAGAVAPRPLRRAAGRRPRRRATPASCTRGCARRWSCPPGPSAMELDVDALPAAPGAGRPADLRVPAGADRPGPGGRRRGARPPRSTPPCARARGSCWRSLRLFDVYTGAPVPAGRGRWRTR